MFCQGSTTHFLNCYGFVFVGPFLLLFFPLIEVLLAFVVELGGDEEFNFGHVECEILVELASRAVQLAAECTCLNIRSELKI